MIHTFQATSLISDFAYCDPFYCSVVCLPACLSTRSGIALKRQKISTGFLLHSTAPWLSQIALKFGLHRSPFPPQILPQSDPHPADLSVGDIQWQVAAKHDMTWHVMTRWIKKISTRFLLHTTLWVWADRAMWPSFAKLLWPFFYTIMCVCRIAFITAQGCALSRLQSVARRSSQHSGYATLMLSRPSDCLSVSDVGVHSWSSGPSPAWSYLQCSFDIFTRKLA